MAFLKRKLSLKDMMNQNITEIPRTGIDRILYIFELLTYIDGIVMFSQILNSSEGGHFKY